MFLVSRIEAAIFFMAAAKSENKTTWMSQIFVYSWQASARSHHFSFYSPRLCGKKKSKKKHLELPNYITFVLKKNTAFTYNKRVNSGSSEKHVQQAIQEIFGEPPSPRLCGWIIQSVTLIELPKRQWLFHFSAEFAWIQAMHSAFCTGDIIFSQRVISYYSRSHHMPISSTKLNTFAPCSSPFSISWEFTLW